MCSWIGRGERDRRKKVVRQRMKTRDDDCAHDSRRKPHVDLSSHLPSPQNVLPYWYSIREVCFKRNQQASKRGIWKDPVAHLWRLWKAWNLALSRSLSIERYSELEGGRNKVITKLRSLSDGLEEEDRVWTRYIIAKISLILRCLTQEIHHKEMKDNWTEEEIRKSSKCKKVQKLRRRGDEKIWIRSCGRVELSWKQSIVFRRLSWRDWSWWQDRNRAQRIQGREAMRKTQNSISTR